MSDLRSILLDIRKKHGKLNPTLVREEARSPRHPLHSYPEFMWDDDQRAAEAHRLEVAAKLIRIAFVTVERKDGSTFETRAFRAVRASTADEYDYPPIEEALADPFRRKMLLNDMRRQIDELVTVFEGVEEFWQEIRKLARRRKAS